MSLANQDLQFLLELGSGQPWGRLPVAQMLGDMTRVKAEFTRFLENGGRVMVGPNPILNFDVPSFIPNSWEIRESDQIQSRVKGRWELILNKIGHHLDLGQKARKVIRGHELKQSLDGQPVLPAHVLDYLLEHPELIPEAWKGKAVFFWGTIYRGAGGNLYVRYLYWDGDRWHWLYSWLDNGWCESHPSAVSAS